MTSVRKLLKVSECAGTAGWRNEFEPENSALLFSVQKIAPLTLNTE